eukprot:936409-Pleurochrysis_carterae.AAC.1
MPLSAQALSTDPYVVSFENFIQPDEIGAPLLEPTPSSSPRLTSSLSSATLSPSLLHSLPLLVVFSFWLSFLLLAPSICFDLCSLRKFAAPLSPPSLSSRRLRRVRVPLCSFPSHERSTRTCRSAAPPVLWPLSAR